MTAHPKTIPQPADFSPAPDLTRAPPLDDGTATLIDRHLRAIDRVHIRVLGEDRAASQPVEQHLRAKGLGVEVSLSERMIPPPRSRYVFRYQGRTAFLTIAPELD